ncbi:MAG: ribosome silencing factor [Opitutaceae bacterium]|nr:ribosome silencing factor [Opitutaceae bacterium]
MPSDSSTELDLVRDIVRILDDKKAIDLRVLRVSEQSSITDFLVLATGTSEPHLRALRVELEKVLDARHARIAGMDTGEPGSGWTVVDAYQVMIHLFTQEKRDEYRLENLWKDADELSVAQVLNPDAAMGDFAKAKAKAKAKPKKKTLPVKPARRLAASKRAKTARVPKAKKKAAPKKSAPRKTRRSR